MKSEAAERDELSVTQAKQRKEKVEDDEWSPRAALCRLLWVAAACNVFTMPPAVSSARGYMCAGMLAEPGLWTGSGESMSLTFTC